MSVEEPDRSRRKSRNRKPKQALPTMEVSDESLEGEKKETPTPLPVLMVEIENIVHDKFRQTEEVKVKPIEDVSRLNFVIIYNLLD